MQADEPRRVGKGLRDIFERDARRVRRENRLGLRLLFERREQTALRFEIFEDRFDDHVGARNTIAIDIRNKTVGRSACTPLVAQSIGVDNVTYESDYPHSDSTWPRTRQIAEEQMKDLDPGSVEKIVRGNAIRMLSL